MKFLDSVAAVLDTLGAPFALVGGRAVIARGYTRATIDYDFLTADGRILDPASWATLAVAGVRVDCRRGDFDDPIADVARLTFPMATKRTCCSPSGSGRRLSSNGRSR